MINKTKTVTYNFAGINWAHQNGKIGKMITETHSYTVFVAM